MYLRTHRVRKWWFLNQLSFTILILFIEIVSQISLTFVASREWWISSFDKLDDLSSRNDCQVCRQVRYREIPWITNTRCNCASDEIDFDKACGRHRLFLRCPSFIRLSVLQVQHSRDDWLIVREFLTIRGQRHLPGFWEHQYGHMDSVLMPLLFRTSMCMANLV